MADSFVFFRLMYETGMDIEDEKTRLEYFEALFRYGLDGTPPPSHLKAYLRGSMYSIDQRRTHNERISNAMVGNSNAVKTWEKVSKQYKTVENSKNSSLKEVRSIEDRSIEDKKIEENKNKKKKYMDFVFLTESEHTSLVNKFGVTKAQYWIERLNSYIGQIGIASASKKYKSHYFTILNRERREGGKTSSDFAKDQALAKHREKIREQIDEYLHPTDSGNVGSKQEAQAFDRRGEILGS